MSRFNGFFDNFSNLGNPKGNLGDYQHASRLYIANNMRLAPKFKFLYHVVLNINPQAQNRSPLLSQIDKREINLLAISADLPKYDLQTETLNQYNRKKIVQTGVRYLPVNIAFHDDNAGLTSLLWEAYFRYYYTDSNYTEKNADSTPKISVDAYAKAANGLNNSYGTGDSQQYKYGLDRPNKQQNFFTSIQIFQLHPQMGRSTYTSFTLVNPFIENFTHDEMSQENSEFSVNRMSINYEAVQYNRGYTEVGNAPTGFAETHYDQAPSPLSVLDPSSLLGIVGAIAGSNNSVPELRRGNYQKRIAERQVLGFQNTKEQSFEGIRNDGFSALSNVESSVLGNIQFPRPPTTTEVTEANIKRF
jgi:hypothetical protein